MLDLILNILTIVLVVPLAIGAMILVVYLWCGLTQALLPTLNRYYPWKMFL